MKSAAYILQTAKAKDSQGRFEIIDYDRQNVAMMKEPLWNNLLLNRDKSSLKREPGEQKMNVFKFDFVHSIH